VAVTLSTFDVLSDGETFLTPSRTLDDHTLRALIGLGGYTHPMFTDAEFAARTPFGRTVLPGEGVLHLMGGMVEQTGRFDETTMRWTCRNARGDTLVEATARMLFRLD
jgi:acyl dehydratase